MSNTPEEKHPIPIYQVNDRVMKVHKDGFVFSGHVHRVIPAHHVPEFITKLLNDERQMMNDSQLTSLNNRDPGFLHNPMYIIVPDTYPGPPTYEEACVIVPGLTRFQYTMLYHYRAYLCLESDLEPRE